MAFMGLLKDQGLYVLVVPVIHVLWFKHVN